MTGMVHLPMCAGCRRRLDAGLLKQSLGRLWCVECFPRVGW